MSNPSQNNLLPFFFHPAADGKTFADTNRACGWRKIVKYQISARIESCLLKDCICGAGAGDSSSFSDGGSPVCVFFVGSFSAALEAGVKLLV